MDDRKYCVIMDGIIEAWGFTKEEADLRFRTERIQHPKSAIEVGKIIDNTEYDNG